MFHIVANRNWRRGRCPAVLPGAAGVRGVRPGHLACRGGPRVPPCLQQSPSIIVADTGRWRWRAPPGQECRALGIIAAPPNQSWQLWVLFPCHSVYLGFALHTLWVYALFIRSSRSRGWKRKEGKPVFCLVSLTNMGGVGMMTGCWAHLHTQWCKISSPFHQEPRSYSNK